MNAERIDEIERGCAGVTRGPWVAVEGQWGDHSEGNGGGGHLLLGDSGGPLGGTIVSRLINYGDGIYPEDQQYQEVVANIEHIARLDPQTVLELCKLAKTALARQAPPLAGAVTVKPLEWVGSENRDEFTLLHLQHRAKSIFGTYIVWDEMQVAGHTVRPGWERPGAVQEHRCDTIGEAKAAAQADYEARILPALSPQPAPAVTEARTDLLRRLDVAADGIETIDMTRRSWRRSYENLLREARSALASQPAAPAGEWVTLRAAFEAAQYQPGDHPVVPVKIAAFMDTVRDLLAASPPAPAPVPDAEPVAGDDPTFRVLSDVYKHLTYQRDSLPGAADEASLKADVELLRDRVFNAMGLRERRTSPVSERARVIEE